METVNLICHYFLKLLKLCLECKTPTIFYKASNEMSPNPFFLWVFLPLHILSPDWPSFSICLVLNLGTSFYQTIMCSLDFLMPELSAALRVTALRAGEIVQRVEHLPSVHKNRCLGQTSLITLSLNNHSGSLSTTVYSASFSPWHLSASEAMYFVYFKASLL